MQGKRAEEPGSNPGHRMMRNRRTAVYFQPEIETMPRAELQALQLERLRESLRNAYG